MNENDKVLELLEKSIDQNDAAYKMMADVAKQMSEDKEQSKKKTAILPWIFATIMVIAVGVIFLVSHLKTLDFFSQYEFSYEETTVNQDTTEGGGDNVFMPGESATFNATPKGE